MKAWQGVGEAYSESYAALCAGMLPVMGAALGEPRGRALLDVGAGDGRLAAAWADAGWRVTACEPEPSMRAVALRRHPGLDVVDAALPALPFADDAFDVVVANFVLNHVDSPRDGAAELRRASRGTVLATIWSSSPSWLWAEVVARAQLTPFVGPRLAAEEEFERTPAGFERMLRDAGFADAVVSEHVWTWEARPSALWLSVEGGVAGAGAHYASLAREERSRFRAAFEALTAERSVHGVLPLEHRALLATCTG
ncbi:class I SAM-dependent methyltransferase [Streptomyces sp. AC495_CC817]|uniref:class I SAM-dependent methyltransferase n=1 Tax=Streptomyces sp. AC495_CC817 TaxID=2823900 RepID=UPI001C26C2BD|nr:class I SAM-dependent methyltransferase [Streptomyces sp. AC495_CC817]